MDDAIKDSPKYREYCATVTNEMAVAGHKVLRYIAHDRCPMCNTNTEHVVQEEGQWQCPWSKCGFTLTADELYGLHMLFVPITKQDRAIIKQWKIKWQEATQA